MSSETPANLECLDAALEYVDRGFSVIPVMSSTKRPYFSWAEYQKRRPSREEIETWWARYPDANVAIICGAISGIYCVDGDGEAGKEWIAENLAPTTVYSETARGIHAIYRIPPNAVIRNRVRLAPQVDIRGEGGYFVAPPSVHQSGHRYRWIMMGDGWEDLPEYAPPAISSLNLDLTTVQPSPISRLQGAPSGERNDSLTRLVGRWIAKGLDPDEVLELALAWAAKCDPPLPEREVRRTVESVHRTHARNHGPPVQVFVPGPHADSIPKEIYTPGGFIQSMVRYIDEASPVSHPTFSCLSSCITLGAVCGQKIQTESGLRTNLYGVGLGYSGAGKDAPHSTIPHLLSYTRAHEIIGPNTLTSDAALLRRLSQSPNQLCLLDEMASVLKALKNPNSPLVGLPALLMQLWSGTDRGYLKPYASGDEIVVPWHHLSLYGTSTPERFWESITPGEVCDGFLARVIVFDIRDDAPRPKMNIRLDVPQELVETIDRLYTIHVPTRGGNMESIPDPHVVRLNPDAAQILDEFADHYHKEKNRHKTSPDGRSAIYGRAAENAWKLALIHATSLHLEQVIHVGIGRQSMEWATRIIQWSVENTIKSIQLHVAANEWHAMEQKVLRLMREKVTKRKPGLTKRQILQGVWGLSSKNCDMILNTMMESGKIVAQNYIGRNNRGCTIYCLPVDDGNADD